MIKGTNVNQGVASLPQKTLRAGIILGALGLLATVFSNFFFWNFGVNLSEAGVSNALYVAFTVIYQLVISAFLPFSAALISASLVMRYLTAPDGQPFAMRRGAGDAHHDDPPADSSPHRND